MIRTRYIAIALAFALGAAGQDIERPTTTELESASPTSDDPVRITTRPSGIVYGEFSLAVSLAPPAVKASLVINGIRSLADEEGPSAVFQLEPGMFVRRYRYRVEGLDAEGRVVGQDEITINDPRPPFRVRVLAPPELPDSGMFTINASVTAPSSNPVTQVEFFLGEQSVGADKGAPFSVEINRDAFDPFPTYARAVAVARDGQEANHVVFFEDRLNENVDVIVKEIPVSVKGNLFRDLTIDELTLIDSGVERTIESLIPARDMPLNIILLIDSSESMLEELPVLKEAASGFAKSVLDGRNQIAVVAFTERSWWLTGFTRNQKAIDASLENLRPRGETHLYDTTIQMLYQLQKMPGRRALVVLTDGVNQGGDFKVEHVVHYARYSGIPIYPILQNSVLAKLRYIPLVSFEAERYMKIADEAGASWFLIKKPKQLPNVYASIARELRNQYFIRFRTQTTRRELWHPIRLKTSEKDVEIRTPRGYFP
jgi:VWFA-related protein